MDRGQINLLINFLILTIQKVLHSWIAINGVLLTQF